MMKIHRRFMLAALVSTSLGVAAVPALADPAAPADGQQVAHFDGDRGPPRGMHGPHGPGRGGPPGTALKSGPGGFRGGPAGGPGWHGGPPPMLDMIMERFDADGDGQITADEVAGVTAARVEQFDRNGDGRLSLEEYKALWTDAMSRQIVRSFQALDPDGDAQVTLDEYAERSDRLFSRFDRDGDGTITAAEFGPQGGHGPDRPAPPPGMGPGGPGAPDLGPDGPDGEPG